GSAGRGGMVEGGFGGRLAPHTGKGVRRTVHERRTLRAAITPRRRRGAALKYCRGRGGTLLTGGTLRGTVHLRRGGALTAAVVLAGGPLGRYTVYGVVGRAGRRRHELRPKAPGHQEDESQCGPRDPPLSPFRPA